MNWVLNNIFFFCYRNDNKVFTRRESLKVQKQSFLRMYVFQGASAQGTMMVIVLFLITTICGFSRATSLCATYKKDTGNGSTTHAGEADPSINRIHFRIPVRNKKNTFFIFITLTRKKTVSFF